VVTAMFTLLFVHALAMVLIGLLFRDRAQSLYDRLALEDYRSRSGRAG
jgi:hypothetical protein